MNMDNTTLFNVEMLQRANIKLTLKEVCESLSLKGYDPIKQLAGYLISGDPGYISTFQDARSKIQSIERADILAYLLREVLK